MKKQPNRSKNQDSQEYPVETPDSSLSSELKKYEGMDFKSLIDQVQSEYKIAYDFMKPKIDEWALRLKLYNNQKRDKEAVGDPLMFTVHQTVLSSLYSDNLSTEFLGREEGDDEIAETLNTLARYDEDDMQKDIVNYEWDWDASFFGRGLCLFMEFDRKPLTPIPEVIDIMTWLRDPKAKSVNGDRKGRGAMRFGGREIRLTKRELKEAGVYFNYSNIKEDGKDVNSVLDRNSELRAEAQGLGYDGKNNLTGENKDYRILEWFTYWQSQKVLVSLAENRTKVVRYTILDNSPWPIIDRAIYPMSKDWDGVSIPDLTEDKQRARAVMQNLGMKGVKAGLNPMYLYNTSKITNKADLNFDFNKFIPVNGDASNAVIPLQTQGVKQEVKWIMDVLDTAAQKATASPDMQQGVQSNDKRTLGELQLINSKVDTRYSLSAKIFGWSEKRFWQQWYRLYKKHFKEGIDEKAIRIAGAMGYSWRKLSRADIVLHTDPDIEVESSVISEEKRFQKLQMFRAYIKDVLAVSGNQANMRFALKKLGKLSGLTKDEIDRIIPQNIDELRSEEENTSLDNGKLVVVEPSDDDMIHIENHNRATDTPLKYAHIQAHKKAMLLKKERPDLFPQLGQQVNPQETASLMQGMQTNGQGLPVQPNQATNVPAQQ